MFDKLKVIDQPSEVTKTATLRFYNRIISESKDTLLVSEARKEIKTLEGKKIVEVDVKIKKADVSKIPSDILKKFNTNEDKFTSITFLKHKKNNESLNLYIGIKNNMPFLRMVCKYSGTNWVFFNKIIFLIDGVAYDYYPKSSSKREVITGGVYERIDDLIIDYDDKQQLLINALANCKETLEIRFSGDRVADRKLKVTPAIRETLDLYNLFDEK